MALKHWHLIAYDVRDAKRLRQVAKHLESYGNRVQYSIFRCRLDPRGLEKLHWELAKILSSEDDLLIIPICDHCAAKVPNHSSGDQSDWTAGPPTFDII
jgi:CRISPR-associated protein Cas2